jgi:hypothetical protein
MPAIEHGPFAVMDGANWNVLDSRGCRIACCGGDSNADWERHGPPIAAAIVKALNQHAALEEVMHWAQATLTALNVGDVASGSPLHLKLREVMIAFREKTRPAEGGGL